MDCTLPTNNWSIKSLHYLENWVTYLQVVRGEENSESEEIKQLIPMTAAPPTPSCK